MSSYVDSVCLLTQQSDFDDFYIEIARFNYNGYKIRRE